PHGQAHPQRKNSRLGPITIHPRPNSPGVWHNPALSHSKGIFHHGDVREGSPSALSGVEHRFRRLLAACERISVRKGPAWRQIPGDDVRRVITRFDPENVRANQPLVEMLQRFAEAKGATPAQVSLAWMLAKWPFVTPIPGARTTERIEENLSAADVELAPGELAALERELAKIPIHGNRTDEDIMKLRELLQRRSRYRPLHLHRADHGSKPRRTGSAPRASGTSRDA